MSQSQRVACPACAEPIPANASVCPICRQPVDQRGARTPSARPETDSDAPDRDVTGGVIPYRNMPALLAYYTGVFSVLPCFPLGIVACVLGIVGLKKARREPHVGGQIHAWIGVLAGGMFGILWTAATIVTVIALITSGR